MILATVLLSRQSKRLYIDSRLFILRPAVIIRILGIVYNMFTNTDPFIAEDSMQQIRKFMVKNQYPGNIVEMGKIDISNPLDIDFHPFFQKTDQEG